MNINNHIINLNNKRKSQILAGFSDDSLVKGNEELNHKYVKRTGTPGNYRYEYDYGKMTAGEHRDSMIFHDEEIKINGNDEDNNRTRLNLVHHNEEYQKHLRLAKEKESNKIDIYKEEFKVIKDAFSILDSLGGNISGDYKKDKLKVEKNYNKTFSEEDYQQAYQINEQP